VAELQLGLDLTQPVACVMELPGRLAPKKTHGNNGIRLSDYWPALAVRGAILSLYETYGLSDWGIEIVVLVKLVQPIGSHQVQQLGITDRDGILRAVLSQLPGACFLHARIALEFLSPT
jgi:hypothetical protein